MDLSDERYAHPHGGRRRRRGEARRRFRDREVLPHRRHARGRERRHGHPRRGGDLSRASQYSGPGLFGGADRDHGRGREHPDALHDHLRPGSHPLPSARARRDQGSRRSRSGALRPGLLRPHRLRAHQYRPRRPSRPYWRATGAFAGSGAARVLLAPALPDEHRLCPHLGRGHGHARRAAEAPREIERASRRCPGLALSRVRIHEAILGRGAVRPGSAFPRMGRTARALPDPERALWHPRQSSQSPRRARPAMRRVPTRRPLSSTERRARCASGPRAARGSGGAPGAHPRYLRSAASRAGARPSRGRAG